MVFLDPRTDIAFKKLFGDITHKNIIMSFLNNVLGREEGHKIIDVVMNDPHNTPETPAFKASIVDVRCTDQSGFQYIVEMQVTEQKDYGARALYYSSFAFTRQLLKSEKYKQLMPVIFVGILDFALFKNPDYLSHHAILDTKTFACELQSLEFHFIELAKFDKPLENLDTILDKWIYFLKYADSLNTIPKSLQEPIIKEAFDVLEQGNWSRGELEAYDAYLDAARCTASQLETAEERGRLKEKIDMARKLLGRFDIDEIAQVTGLSIADIENIKNKKS